MLPQKAIDFLKTNRPPFVGPEGGGVVLVATVSKFGIVNLSPRFVLEVNDKELYFISALGNKTLANLRDNNKLCIMKWESDLKTGKILKIEGEAENITSGEKFEKFASLATSAGFPRPLVFTKVKFISYEYMG